MTGSHGVKERSLKVGDTLKASPTFKANLSPQAK